MKIYAVEYIYDPEKSATIDEIRPTHRAWLKDLYDEGVVKASGPLNDVDPPGAMVILESSSQEAALKLLEDDPFFTAGVIQARKVSSWTPVLGPWA